MMEANVFKTKVNLENGVVDFDDLRWLSGINFNFSGCKDFELEKPITIGFTVPNGVDEEELKSHIKKTTYGLRKVGFKKINYDFKRFDKDSEGSAEDMGATVFQEQTVETDVTDFLKTKGSPMAKGDYDYLFDLLKIFPEKELKEKIKDLEPDKAKQMLEEAKGKSKRMEGFEPSLDWFEVPKSQRKELIDKYII